MGPPLGGSNVWVLPRRMGSPYGWLPLMRTPCTWNVRLLWGRMGTSPPMVLPRTRTATSMGRFNLYPNPPLRCPGSSISSRAKTEQAATTQAALSVPSLSGQVILITILLMPILTSPWRARDYYPWLPPGALPFPGGQLPHQHYFEEFRSSTSLSIKKKILSLFLLLTPVSSWRSLFQWQPFRSNSANLPLPPPADYSWSANVRRTQVLLINLHHLLHLVLNPWPHLSSPHLRELRQRLLKTLKTKGQYRSSPSPVEYLSLNWFNLMKMRWAHLYFSLLGI